MTRFLLSATTTLEDIIALGKVAYRKGDDANSIPADYNELDSAIRMVLGRHGEHSVRMIEENSDIKANQSRA